MHSSNDTRHWVRSAVTARDPAADRIREVGTPSRPQQGLEFRLVRPCKRRAALNCPNRESSWTYWRHRNNAVVQPQREETSRGVAVGAMRAGVKSRRHPLCGRRRGARALLGMITGVWDLRASRPLHKLRTVQKPVHDTLTASGTTATRATHVRVQAAWFDVAPPAWATNAAWRESSEAPYAHRPPALPSDGAQAADEHALPAPTDACWKQEADEDPSAVAQLKVVPMGASALRDKGQSAWRSAQRRQCEITCAERVLASLSSPPPQRRRPLPVAPAGRRPVS